MQDPGDALMPAADAAALEKELVAQIVDINKRIDELLRDRAAINRAILKVRQRNSALKDVSRKNSLNRVLVESQILEILGRSSGPVSSQVLFKEAQNVHPDLKSETFRSHLHRMKRKEAIKSKGSGWYYI